MAKSASRAMTSRLRRWGAVLLHRTGLLGLFRRWTNRLDVSRRGSAGVPVIRRHRSGKIQILLYHRVAPEQDDFLPSMPLAVFERQMEYLARTCSVIGLEQAVDGLRGCDVPDNAVVITFDDGYRDNRIHALPVLSAMSLPATVFLVTGSIGTGRLIWHDRVFRAFVRTTCRELREFGPQGRSFGLNGTRQRDEVRAGVLRYLKGLGVEKRDAEIAKLTDRLQVEDAKTCAGVMLDWRDVRSMQGKGVSFGAHTVTHPILSRISEEDARAEIEQSKKAIETNLGEAVCSFAYPNGGPSDFTLTTKKLLRDAGFTCALTTTLGTNLREPAKSLDFLELRRLSLEENNMSAFGAKLDLYRLLSTPTG